MKECDRASVYCLIYFCENIRAGREACEGHIVRAVVQYRKRPTLTRGVIQHCAKSSSCICIAIINANVEQKNYVLRRARHNSKVKILVLNVVALRASKNVHLKRRMDFKNIRQDTYTPRFFREANVTVSFRSYLPVAFTTRLQCFNKCIFCNGRFYVGNSKKKKSLLYPVRIESRDVFIVSSGCTHITRRGCIIKTAALAHPNKTHAGENRFSEKRA